MNEKINFNIFTAINTAVEQLESYSDDLAAEHLQNLTKIFNGQLAVSDFNDSIMVGANKEIADLLLNSISVFDGWRYNTSEVLALYLISSLLSDPENLVVLSHAILTCDKHE